MPYFCLHFWACAPFASTLKPLLFTYFLSFYSSLFAQSRGEVSEFFGGREGLAIQFFSISYAYSFIALLETAVLIGIWRTSSNAAFLANQLVRYSIRFESKTTHFLNPSELVYHFLTENFG